MAVRNRPRHSFWRRLLHSWHIKRLPEQAPTSSNKEQHASTCRCIHLDGPTRTQLLLDGDATRDRDIDEVTWRGPDMMDGTRVRTDEDHIGVRTGAGAPWPGYSNTFADSSEVLDSIDVGGLPDGREQNWPPDGYQFPAISATDKNFMVAPSPLSKRSSRRYNVRNSAGCSTIG